MLPDRQRRRNPLPARGHRLGMRRGIGDAESESGGQTMTEKEWLGATDPTPLLRYLIGTDAPRVQDVEAFPDARGSDRKLRIFACACYDRICHVLPHPVARDTVRTA